MSGRIRGNPPGLDARSIAQLKKASLSANDILSNIDELNAERDDFAKVPTQTLPAQAVEEEDELERIEKAFAAKQARELAEAEAKAAAEKEKPAAQAPAKEVSIEDQVRGLLREAKAGPSEAQIEAWKREYGEESVQVIALGKSDVYVFTYLRRINFQRIQIAMAKKAQLEPDKDPEEFMTEQVLKQCVLWPKLSTEFFYNSRSGVIPTLYNAVMLHSYHLSPQQAMVLTAQL
jgi:hypothetical protein